MTEPVTPYGPSAHYLGDGVYVEHDARGLVLTTSDGLRRTNSIVLELEVFAALIAYAMRQGLNVRAVVESVTDR